MDIVFDFDGTIADTLKEVVKVINQLAPDYGFQTIGDKDIALFRRVGSKKAMKTFGVSWIKFIRVGRRVQKLMNAGIPDTKIFPGMKKVFSELKKRGMTLGILSSNSKENLTDFLKENGLSEVFDYVVPCGLMWGKARRLKRIMKKRHLGNGELVYIGDETKDVIACRKANIKSIAVTWGYNSEEALKAYNPDWVVRKPEEIVKIINKACSG